MTYDSFIRLYNSTCDGEFTLAESRRAIEIFVETLKEVMMTGDEVRFKRFGQFCLKKKGGQIGRNPRTGEEMKIPIRMTPTFVPSRILKEEVGEAVCVK